MLVVSSIHEILNFLQIKSHMCSEWIYVYLGLWGRTIQLIIPRVPSLRGDEVQRCNIQQNFRLYP